MPLTASIRQAVLAAARRAAEGRPVSLTDRAWWAQFGSPPMAVRRDVRARSNALEAADQAAILNEFQGTFADLFQGTGFPAGSGATGPADTPQATVYARLMFETPSGGIAYRSISGSFAWDASLEDAYAWIEGLIGDFADMYGLEGGELVGESLFIF